MDVRLGSDCNYAHALLHVVLKLVGVALVSKVEWPLAAPLGSLPMPMGQEGW